MRPATLPPIDKVPRRSQSACVRFVECKKWKRPIDKSDFVSFKGAVDDVGAARGYMVSERGFRSGAINMARGTNATLCSASELDVRILEWQLDPASEKSKHYRSGATKTTTGV